MADNKEGRTITISNNAITIVLVTLLVGASFAIGMLWTRVQNLEGPNSGNTVTGNAQAPAGNPNAARPVNNVEPVSDSDHVRGDRNAKIALIEYSDFECPYCKNFHPTAQRVVDEYDGEVMWVYRHFPLTQIHPKAQKYAEATECAALQGGDEKFWELGDAIFEQQPALTGLGDLAAEIGLNQTEFQECLDSGQMEDIVKEQQAGGTKSGITGTPGNIILNIESGEAQLVSGAQPFAVLQGVIDSMME